MITKEFLKGFIKIASPELVEQTYDSDGSEYTRKSQAILEQSYNDDKDETPGTSRERITKKAVSEAGTTSSPRPVGERQ